jgi:hypothetical protein
MFRKIIVGLLTFLMLMTATIAIVDFTIGTVSADSSNGYSYVLIENGNAAKITKYSGPGGNTTIPDFLGGKPVTSLGDRAFSGQWYVTTISIPQSVTYIGNSTFGSCGIASIIIPGSVTNIGEGAFGGCSNLKDAVIDNNIISNDEFYDCGALTSITLSKNLTIIGLDGFFRCDPTSIVIPDGVRTIADGAFWDCYDLKNVELGNNVSTIGDSAFYNDPIAFINIPNSVTYIGDMAFLGASFTTITIPNANIGFRAFLLCDSLVSVTIGNGTKWIGDQAFLQLEDLTSVVIGGSVTSIGNDSFNSGSMRSITFEGLSYPKYLGSDWFGSLQALGHAYEASNFPAPGETFYGLTMGSYNGGMSSATVPGVPTGLTATIGNGQITLKWAAPLTEGIVSTAYYQISINGTMKSDHITSTSTTITGLTNGVTYSFAVAAHGLYGTGISCAPIKIAPSSTPLLTTISGVVTDVKGNRVTNVTVTLQSTTFTGIPPRTTTTDVVGAYTFQGVPADEYSMKVINGGSEVASTTVTVTSGNVASGVGTTANLRTAVGSSTFDNSMMLIAILALLAIIAIAIAILMVRRKRALP